MNCPVCSGKRVRRAPTPDFRPIRNRRCLDCGAVWQPNVPYWLAILFIVVGLALCSFVGVSLFEEASGYLQRRGTAAGRLGWERGVPTEFIWGWVVAGLPGLLFLGYGIAVISGMAGKLRILQAGGHGNAASCSLAKSEESPTTPILNRGSEFAVVTNARGASPSKGQTLIVRFARYSALTMSVIGFLLLTHSASNKPSSVPTVVVVAPLILLTIGVATVLGLKSAVIRFPAACLNAVFSLAGVYLIVVIPPDTIGPELRRMLGAFCALGGGINTVGLLLCKPKKVP
jgi:hypothetical protein